MRRLLKSKKGQTSTEYMMVISVIVIAVTAAAYVFVPSFGNGVDELSQDVSTILKDHGSTKGGFGLAANGASDNGAGGGSTTTASAQGGGF